MTTKAQSAKTKEAEKRSKEAAEREAALNQADADFREDVAKAAEKRAKVREKYNLGTNIAETAWNETKADEDPEYSAVALTHRQKLDDAVAAIRSSGNADIVGLEDFEARVVELLAEAGTPAGSGTVFDASATPGKDADADEAKTSEKSKPKSIK